MNKNLLENYIKTFSVGVGNASLAGRMSGVSEGHARKELTGLSREDALRRINQFESVSTPDKSEIFLPIADIHYGEIIKPHILNGDNEYNSRKAKDRLLTIFAKLHESMHQDVEVVHIANMGDPISGMLHEENMTNDEMSPMRAINELSKLLVSQIRFFHDEFPGVRIEIHSVLDNHSRTTRRRRFKSSEDYSYNSQLTTVLQIAFEQNDLITAHDAKETIVVGIAGLNWGLSHGDVGNGGTVSGGIKGQAVQRLQAVENAWMDVGIKPDYCMIGHFHMFAQIENWFICPPVCGTNEYATYSLRVKPKPPKSLIFECQSGKIVKQELFRI